MPDLFQSLQKYDAGHLHIVADLWGVEMTARETGALAEELCSSLLDPDLLAEVIEALPPEARAAIDTLHARSGRIPWAEFTRQFGEIREMGPGKRDRERPHFTPASPGEVLFYRALLGRAFFDTPSGPQEFAYIPNDLLVLINDQNRKGNGATNESPLASVPSMLPLEPLGRPALPGEKAHLLPLADFLLDDATTLLAALRLGIVTPQTRVPEPVLERILKAAKVILKSGPESQAVKAFLESPRHKALALLRKAWSGSEDFNEMRQVPGLIPEGEWRNQPRETREFLLHLLRVIPEGKWWSLPAFIHDVKAKHPDFQRPAGEYDSWFIKRASDGEYLRGFAHWDQVDGALIRYVITGPCYWLGLVDLAAPGQGVEPAAFRLRSASIESQPEEARWHVASQGSITVPRLVPRAARYQVSRFCEWLEARGDEYRYQITPASLSRAREQELNPEHLLPLLAKYSTSGVPPALVKALKRWQAHGTEARMGKQILLRVSQPEILKELRKSKAARFLGEALSPTAVVVKDGAQSKVLAALAELGYLAEDEAETSEV